jgi:4-oxalocrotonate tautomerase
VRYFQNIQQYFETKMPIISIKIAKGRSIETKRKLVKSVTKAVSESLDLSPDLTSVIIEEFERDNWATGGELHSDKYGNSFGKKK